MKKRTLLVIMLVSLAFNAAFIAGAAGKRLQKSDGKKDINRLEKMFENDRKMFDDLDLSAEQREKVNAIQDNYQKKKLIAIKDFHVSYNEALNEAAKGNFDGEMLEKYKQTATKSTMPSLLIDEKFEIMKILTPEQRKAVLGSLTKRGESVKKDVDDMLEKMNK